MIKKIWTLSILLFPFSLFSQIKNPEFKEMLDDLYENTVPLMTVDSLKYLKNVYLLDTREKEEYEISHLKNARNVGYVWFDMRDIYDIPQDATIVVYCSIGFRSEKIGEKLIKNGYKHVFNLYGGIFEWANQRNPMYRSNGVQTPQVHPYNKKWNKWLEIY